MEEGHDLLERGASHARGLIRRRLRLGRSAKRVCEASRPWTRSACAYCCHCCGTGERRSGLGLRRRKLHAKLGGTALTLRLALLCSALALLCGAIALLCSLTFTVTESLPQHFNPQCSESEWTIARWTPQNTILVARWTPHVLVCWDCRRSDSRDGCQTHLYYKRSRWATCTGVRVRLTPQSRV